VEARARLTLDGVFVIVVARGRLQFAHGHLLRVGEPSLLGLRRGNRDEEPHVAPRDGPLGEGAGDRGEGLQPLHHVGQVLQLAAGEAEAFARVVVEPDEAEAVMAAAEEQRRGEATEDAAAEGLLAREAAEKAVEQLGAEVPVEPAVVVGGEELGCDQVHRC